MKHFFLFTNVQSAWGIEKFRRRKVYHLRTIEIGAWLKETMTRIVDELIVFFSTAGR